MADSIFQEDGKASIRVASVGNTLNIVIDDNGKFSWIVLPTSKARILVRDLLLEIQNIEIMEKSKKKSN